MKNIIKFLTLSLLILLLAQCAKSPKSGNQELFTLLLAASGANGIKLNGTIDQDLMTSKSYIVAEPTAGATTSTTSSSSQVNTFYIVNSSDEIKQPVVFSDGNDKPYYPSVTQVYDSKETMVVLYDTYDYKIPCSIVIIRKKDGAQFCPGKNNSETFYANTYSSIYSLERMVQFGKNGEVFLTGYKYNKSTYKYTDYGLYKIENYDSSAPILTNIIENDQYTSANSYSYGLDYAVSESNDVLFSISQTLLKMSSSQVISVSNNTSTNFKGYNGNLFSVDYSGTSMKEMIQASSGYTPTQVPIKTIDGSSSAYLSFYNYGSKCNFVDRTILATSTGVYELKVGSDQTTNSLTQIKIPFTFSELEGIACADNLFYAHLKDSSGNSFIVKYNFETGFETNPVLPVGLFVVKMITVDENANCNFIGIRLSNSVSTHAKIENNQVIILSEDAPTNPVQLDQIN